MAADTVRALVDSNIMALIQEPGSRQPGDTRSDNCNLETKIEGHADRLSNVPAQYVFPEPKGEVGLDDW